MSSALHSDALSNSYCEHSGGSKAAISGALAPQRLWLHTCDLDGPRALPLYQRAGFVAYDQRIEKVVATDALNTSPRAISD